MNRFLITGRQTQALAVELWHRAADVNTAEIAQRNGPYSDLYVTIRSPRGAQRFLLPPNGETVEVSMDHRNLSLI